MSIPITEEMISAADAAKYDCSEGIEVSRLIGRDGIAGMLRAAIAAMPKYNDRDLSDAYLRLRARIPGAYRTPHAPTPQQVWKVTEDALDAMVAGHVRELAQEREKFIMHTAEVGAWLAAFADLFGVKVETVATACIQIYDAAKTRTEFWVLVNKLREGEGDSITLGCDKPDFGPGPEAIVTFNGHMTNWEDRNWTGDAVLQALQACAADLDAFNAGLHGRRPHPNFRPATHKGRAP